MISQSYNIFRTNKMGKPYVQNTDPSEFNVMSANDIWLNPEAGTMKMWNGTGWVNMQWGESAIMDDCIANRVIAGDVSANKITTGILRSQDGSFSLNLTNGEAKLLKVILGGEVEGNVVASSFDDLTRLRIRGKEGEKRITAGLIFEQRDDSSEEGDWENAGQIYFDYAHRQTWCVFKNYQIGAYNSQRPSCGYNAGSADGLMWRALSTGRWLRSANYTYHGYRLRKRDTAESEWTDVTPVMTAIGNCAVGTSFGCDGIVTLTYKANDIMQLDFNVKVTTAGSGNASYGISRNALRQLNAEVPVITPISGGSLQLIGSNGIVKTSYTGSTLVADGGIWTPACISGGAITAINESDMERGLTLVGTCYGKYAFDED